MSDNLPDLIAKAKPKLGSGARFAHLVSGGMSPALAAFIGRKKYGRKRFQHLAEAAQKSAEDLQQSLDELSGP